MHLGDAELARRSPTGTCRARTAGAGSPARARRWRRPSARAIRSSTSAYPSSDAGSSTSPVPSSSLTRVRTAAGTRSARPARPGRGPGPCPSRRRSRRRSAPAQRCPSSDSAAVFTRRPVVLQAARHPDRPGLVAEVAADLAEHRRRRERAEVDAARPGRSGRRRRPARPCPPGSGPPAARRGRRTGGRAPRTKPTWSRISCSRSRSARERWPQGPGLTSPGLPPPPQAVQRGRVLRSHRPPRRPFGPSVTGYASPSFTPGGKPLHRGDRLVQVLGVNAVFHDPAAALVVDGEIVAAAEEERFSRRKHGKSPVPFSTWELPEQSARWCLRARGLTAGGPRRGGLLLRPRAGAAVRTATSPPTAGRACGRSTRSGRRCSWRPRCPGSTRARAVRAAPRRPRRVGAPRRAVRPAAR